MSRRFVMGRTRRSRSRSTPRPPVAPLGAAESSTREFGVLAAALLALPFLLYLGLYYSEGPHAEQRRGALLGYLLPEELWANWLTEQPGMADRVPLLLLAGGLVAFALAPGSLLLRALGLRDRLTALEHAVLAIGCGLSLMSLTTLLLGLLGLLRFELAYTLPAIVLLVIVGRDWRRRFLLRLEAAHAGTGSTNGLPSGGSRPNRWAVLGSAALGLLAIHLLLAAALPPVDFDVREYHLQAPKEWFQQGAITFLPHNIYANMPLGAELHALPAMAFWPGERAWWWGALTGKVVMAAYSLLAAGGLAALGRRYGGPWGGFLAPLVYLATPGVQILSASGHNEGAVGCYLLLTLLVLCLAAERPAVEIAAPSAPAQPETAGTHAQDSRRPRDWALEWARDWPWYALAGFLAGSAVACKYTGVLFVLLPAMILAAWGRGRLLAEPGREAGAALLRTALVLFAALLACGPWLAKNAALAGNPVYPLLAGQLGGATRTPEKIAQWEAAHRVPADSADRRYTPGLAAAAAADALWRSPWIGPLLVPLALLAIPLAGRPVAGRLWFVLLFGFAVWWLATHRVDRFLVPLYPLAAALAAFGASRRAQPAARGVLVGVLILGIAGGMAGVLWQPLFGRLTWLAEQPPFTSEVHRDLNRRLPSGAKVLLVGDAAPFNLHAEVVYNTCFDDSQLDRWLAELPPPRRRAKLAGEGVTHLLFDWSELARYRSPGNYGYNSLVTPAWVEEELLAPGVVVLEHAWRGEEHAPPYAELYRVSPPPLN